MNTIPANAASGGYQLKSDLARICLPASHAHDERNLAWVNSICLVFLIIGLAGFRATPPPPIPVKPLEEPALVELATPPPPPPTTPEELKPEEPTPDKTEAPPPMVRVTMASPTIRFAVPTPGNIIVPEKLAVAPPGDNGPQAAPAREKATAPSLLGNTGHGGDRPQPEYPKMAQDLGQQGTVVLLLTADEAGIVISAEVEQSSGSSILDHAAADFVKRHWTVAPGARGRMFRAPIRYQLN